MRGRSSSVFNGSFSPTADGCCWSAAPSPACRQRTGKTSASLFGVRGLPTPHPASRLIEDSLVIARAHLPARIGRQQVPQRTVLVIDLEVFLLIRRRHLVSSKQEGNLMVFIGDLSTLVRRGWCGRHSPVFAELMPTPGSGFLILIENVAVARPALAARAGCGSLSCSRQETRKNMFRMRRGRHHPENSGGMQ